MTALVAKNSLKMVPSNLNSIWDAGDTFVIGGNVYKKDLTLFDQNKIMNPYPPGANGVINYSALAFYNVAGYQMSALNIKGSGAALNSITGDISSQGPRYPNHLSFLDDGEFSCYFDSLIGATSGKRYLFLMGDINTNLSVLLVNADNSFSFLYASLGGSSCGGRVYVVGESTAYFYAVAVASAASIGTSGGAAFYKISKADFSSTRLEISSCYFKYLGKTNDNKLWFQTAPITYANGNYGSFGYVILDLINDAIVRSAVFNSGLSPHASTTAATTGVYVPSKFSLNQSDNTKLKSYCVSDPQNATGAFTIKMQSIPINGGSYAANFSYQAWSACTLVGAPTIPLLYSSTGNQLAAGEVVTWTFTDSGNEYIAVAYHSSIDMTSSIYTNNKCSVSGHAIYVFQVDPTNPLNLIYKSTLTNNAFGANTTLSMLLRSKDGKTLVAGSSQGFIPITWNSATESFYNGIWTPISTIGAMHLDTNNQLWVRDFSENLFVFDIGLTNNIVINYDADYVNYTGTTAHVNVLVSSFDLMGNRQAVPVTLAVTGAVFTSNNSNTITVNTLLTGDVSVQLSITSSGNVTVTPII